MEVEQMDDEQIENEAVDETEDLEEEESANEDQSEHRARDYQLELFNYALQRNIIVCLKTGSGKTFISILLIKELQHVILKPFDQGGKVTFFLVPKVALVAQQAQSIESHTTLKVGQYHGGCRVDIDGSKCHIDDWNQDVWAKEFKRKQVFVMTAQILLNLLNHSFITMDKINLIVMDECHQATGNNPYCRIMKFYDKALHSKPKILGLTAAVLHGRCKPADILKNIERLEQTLDSRIVTVSNLEQVYKFSTKPKEVLLEFSDTDTSNDALDLKIEDILNKCEKEVKEITSKLDIGDIETTGAISNREEEGRFVSCIENKSHVMKKLIEKAESASEDANGINFKCSPDYLVKNVRWVYQILGIWPMREILKAFLFDLPNFEKSARKTDQIVKCKIFSILKEHFTKLQDLVDVNINAIGDSQAILKFVTPKVKRLLDILNNIVSEFKPFRGIVFVEQRSIAWMLDHYLRQLRQLHLRDYEAVDPCYVVGHGISLAYTWRTGMNVDDQAESLLLFKEGKRNLLIGTSVVEEGLDIPECNVVIRFDLPKTFCSYVQSKGRARAQKALFFLMHPKGEMNELTNSLVYYRVLEEELIKISMKNKQSQLGENKPRKNGDSVDDMYHKETVKSAAITLDSAISILDRYCSKLPHDRFTAVKPIYTYVKNESDLSQVCSVVHLPTSTSLIERDIVGAKYSDKKTAKKIAAYEACLALYQAGELNEHLLPAINFIERYGCELGIAELKQNDKGRVKSGTRKRKYPYPKAVAENLNNCYIDSNYSLFHLYDIKLIKQDQSNKNPRFGMLTSKLISKVLPFKLFGKLECTVIINKVKDFQDINVFQKIDILKEFHNFIFDDVFQITNSLFEFFPEEAGSFLIIPLKENTINWDLVEKCHKFKNSVEDETLKIPKVGDVILTQYGGVGVKNRRFYVRRVVPREKIPDELFQKTAKYLEKKYNVVVCRRDQPLVTCDYVPNGLNLLHPEIAQKASPKTQKLDTMHFFPEFLKVFPLDIDYYRDAFCLPSIIHRLNGLLLANELKCSLINEASVMPVNQESKFVIVANTLEKLCEDTKVDDSIIFSQDITKPQDPDRLLAVLFQAITTASAANWDSLERLELIGDSFLKIATSICLYCRYPVLHEGGLTTLRTGLVRNFNLVKHSKNIPRILNGSFFLPKVSWVPPGYKIPAELITALVAKSIPNHLWGHAIMDDIISNLNNDSQKWQTILQERWTNAEPPRKMSQEKVTTKYEASWISENSDSNNAKEEVMFDRYFKQLIGDKTIADSVEAIIGAVLVTCGRAAALRTLEWFGLKLLPANDLNSMEVDEESSAFPWTVPKELVERWNCKMSDRYIDLLQFEKDIGYTFKNKGLLLQAVMHPTYDKEVIEHYQKLEFLGDSVLDYLVTMHLCKLFPNLTPGNMTDLRSSLVDNCTFAFLAVENNMNKYLRFKSGLLFNVIDNYLDHKKNLAHPKDTIYLTAENDYSSMEEIEVPKALGDIFESVAGAIFVDSGLSLERVWEIYYPMLKSIIDKYSQALPINPVRCVIEKYPSAKFSKQSKPSKNDPFHRVIVEIEGKVFHGKSKKGKVAKIAAAKSALRSLNILSERELL